MSDPQQPAAPAAAPKPSATPSPAARALADKLASVLDAGDLAEHHVALINKITGEQDLICSRQPDGSIQCL